MTTLSGDLGLVKADVKAFGGILVRIEEGVNKAQERSDEKEIAGKPNLVAVISILITLISIIVGGAWMIGSNLARQEERAINQEKITGMFIDMRNREADIQNKDIRTMNDRVFQLEAQRHDGAPR